MWCGIVNECKLNDNDRLLTPTVSVGLPLTRVSLGSTEPVVEDNVLLFVRDPSDLPRWRAVAVGDSVAFQGVLAETLLIPSVDVSMVVDGCRRVIPNLRSPKLCLVNGKEPTPVTQWDQPPPPPAFEIKRTIGPNPDWLANRVTTGKKLKWKCRVIHGAHYWSSSVPLNSSVFDGFRSLWAHVVDEAVRLKDAQWNLVVVSLREDVGHVDVWFDNNDLNLPRPASVQLDVPAIGMEMLRRGTEILRAPTVEAMVDASARVHGALWSELHAALCDESLLRRCQQAGIGTTRRIIGQLSYCAEESVELLIPKNLAADTGERS
jgi:hypothetical protein